MRDRNASLTVEEDRPGRTTLVVTGLPSQVNPYDLAEKIANLVKEGTVGGIAEVRDEERATATWALALPPRTRNTRPPRSISVSRTRQR